MKPHLEFIDGMWICSIGQFGAIGETWQEALIFYFECYWEDHIGPYLWEN